MLQLFQDLTSTQPIQTQDDAPPIDMCLVCETTKAELVVEGREKDDGGEANEKGSGWVDLGCSFMHWTGKLKRCQFCATCFNSTMRAKINDYGVRATTTLLYCPGCYRKIAFMDVMEHLQEDTQKRWFQLSLLSTLQSMRDLHYCPLPPCENAMWVDEKDPACKKMLCSDCGGASCLECKLRWHGDDVSCEEAKRLDRRANPAEMAFLKWEATHRTKKCPKCGTHAEKVGGCSNVHCGSCDAEFCWHCLKGYTEGEHEHTACVLKVDNEAQEGERLERRRRDRERERERERLRERERERLRERERRRQRLARHLDDWENSFLARRRRRERFQVDERRDRRRSAHAY